MLLRKNTLPFQLGTHQIPDPKNKRFRIKASSQLNRVELIDNDLCCSKKGKQSQFKKNKLENNLKKENTFIHDQIERIIDRNTFTVNFLQKNDGSSLPNLTTFNKIKKLLIKKSLFEQYQQINKKDEQLEKEVDREQYKLNINTHYRLDTKLNAFGKSMKSRSVICDQRQDLKEKFIDKQVHRFSDNALGHKHLQELAEERLKRLHSRSSKWNIKDFLDPIAKEPNTGEEDALRERLNVLEKLQNITQECCSVAEEEEELAKSISLFARFSEKMDEGLIRRKKKLDKVFHQL